MEIITYAYRGNSAAPYRARRVDCRAQDTRAALRRAARRTFGPSVTLAAGPVLPTVDREGRSIYGPAGAEVIPNGAHWQVWDSGYLRGYVSIYGAQ